MTRSPRDDGSGPISEAEVEPSSAVRRVLAENRETFLCFVRRQVRRPDLAEEILHEAIARGLAREHSLRDEGAARAWFYRLLRNATVDHLRAEGAELRSLSAFEREAPLREDRDGDEDLLATLCTCLTGMIEALNADYATALKRVDLGGEPINRFARAQGITHANASVRLHRARRALRQAVDTNCGTCLEHGGYLCECKEERHAVGRPEPIAVRSLGRSQSPRRPPAAGRFR